MREGRPLHARLRLSGMIYGEPRTRSGRFVSWLQPGAVKKISVLFCLSKETEAIKFFANAYLALRVAYVDELDIYAATLGLDTCQIKICWM